MPPSCALFGEFAIAAHDNMRRTQNISERLYSLYMPGFVCESSLSLYRVENAFFVLLYISVYHRVETGWLFAKITHSCEMKYDR